MNNRSLLFACLAFLVSPAFCSGAPKKLPDLKDADAFMKKAFGEDCDRHPTGVPAIEIGPDERFEIPFRKKNETEDRVFPLFQMYCGHSAYNEWYVFLTHDRKGKFKALSFDQPKVKYEYEDENDTKLKHPPKITGMIAKQTLTNAEFDPETHSISNFVPWRGLGDAYHSSKYEFSEGKFELTTFVVDPIYEKNLPESEAAALNEISFTLIPAQ